MTDKCPYCLAGYPVSFCLLDKIEGCYGQDDSDGLDDRSVDRDVDAGLSGSLSDSDVTVGRLFSEPESERVYKDVLSTGRKRAALLFPIQVGQVCSWAWQKNCGGGISPIMGCTGRPATNLHHGPDKSVFNNGADNVSAICEFCHNRWHVANDGYYSLPRPANGATWLPDIGIAEGKKVHFLSSIEKASKQEVLTAELLLPEGGKDRG